MVGKFTKPVEDFVANLSQCLHLGCNSVALKNQFFLRWWDVVFPFHILKYEMDPDVACKQQKGQEVWSATLVKLATCWSQCPAMDAGAVGVGMGLLPGICWCQFGASPSRQVSKGDDHHVGRWQAPQPTPQSCQLLAPALLSLVSCYLKVVGSCSRLGKAEALTFGRILCGPTFPHAQLLGRKALVDFGKQLIQGQVQTLESGRWSSKLLAVTSHLADREAEGPGHMALPRATVMTSVQVLCFLRLNSNVSFDRLSFSGP